MKRREFVSTSLQKKATILALASWTRTGTAQYRVTVVTDPESEASRVTFLQDSSEPAETSSRDDWLEGQSVIHALDQASCGHCSTVHYSRANKVRTVTIISRLRRLLGSPGLFTSDDLFFRLWLDHDRMTRHTMGTHAACCESRSNIHCIVLSYRRDRIYNMKP